MLNGLLYDEQKERSVTIDITPVSKVWLGNLYKCLVYKKLFNEFPKDSKSKKFGDPLGKFLRR